MSGLGQAFGGAINGQIGASAASSAAQSQTNEGNVGLEQANNIYTGNAANYQPYIQGGANAERQLQAGAGPNGNLGRQFTMADFHQDPGYQFDVNQGMQGITNGGTIHGGALSGGTLKGLQNYGQQMASNEYQSAYNRFVGNQNQDFGQLSSMAGQGLGATQGLGQLGSTYSGMEMGQHNNIGNARANGIIGKAQAYEGGITNMAQGASSLGNLGS